jgi:hypothetical protein
VEHCRHVSGAWARHLVRAVRGVHGWAFSLVKILIGLAMPPGGMSTGCRRF